MDCLHKDNMDFNTYVLVLSSIWLISYKKKRLMTQVPFWKIQGFSTRQEKHTLSVDWTAEKTHLYAAIMQIYMDPKKKSVHEWRAANSESCIWFLVNHSNSWHASPSSLRSINVPCECIRISVYLTLNHTGASLSVQVFRTDFITAMKLPDSAQLGPDDFYVLSDPWRQEWEKGVQVPASLEAIPEPVVR